MTTQEFSSSYADRIIATRAEALRAYHAAKARGEGGLESLYSEVCRLDDLLELWS